MPPGRGRNLTWAISGLLSLSLLWLIAREWVAFKNGALLSSVPFSTEATAARGADLVYFYSPACSLCREATPAVVQAARAHPSLRVVFYNVAAADLSQLREKLNRRAGIPAERAGEIPALFTAQGGWVGGEAVRAHLPGAVRTALAPSGSPADPPDRTPPHNSSERSLALWPVLVAAAVDSVNPCALSTALFLISTLFWAGRSRAQLLVTGALFCLGVFCLYALAGLGLLRGLHALSSFPVFPVFLYLVAALLTAGLGLLHLRQYLGLRRGELRPTEVGLPPSFRATAHAAVRNLGERRLAFGVVTFATGAIVAAVELPCTGQVYVPTLMYLTDAGEQGAAVAYLLLYNLVFILPLACLFGVAAVLGSTRTLQHLVRRNLHRTRLVNAVCFFVMSFIFAHRVVG